MGVMTTSLEYGDDVIPPQENFEAGTKLVLDAWYSHAARHDRSAGVGWPSGQAGGLGRHLPWCSDAPDTQLPPASTDASPMRSSQYSPSAQSFESPQSFPGVVHFL